MALSGIPANFYQPLSAKEIEAIHNASLRVLEQAGYLIEHDRALELLADAGCKVDFQKKIVKVPSDILMDTIKRAPARIRLCGRDPKHDIVIEPNRVFFDGGGGSIKIYDFETGERRDSTLQDLATLARMTDALENIHIMDTPCMPNDCAKGELDVNRLFAIANNTTKPLLVGMYDDPERMIKMAQIIAGGEEALRQRPFLSVCVCSISPLKLEPNYVDKLIKVIDAGIPVYIITCPTSGLTAPMTLAGQLVQINAEALFNVFFPQILKAGTPAFYSVVPNIADMRTSRFVFGAVENAMMNAACSQLASFYNLPLYSTAGLTEAKTGDVQAGAEKAMSTLLVALSGAQLVHDTAGMLDSSLTFSADQLVIDNEINGMVLRVLRGIEINEETLAEEVIKSVGPGGDYLSQEHTVKYMRTETFFPQLADRKTYDEWFKDGCKDITQKAHEVARELIANHEPSYLPPETVEHLKEEFPELRTVKSSWF